MKNKEIWLDIPSYEGLYQVSNLGRIKRLSEKYYIKRNKSYGIRKEKILKQGNVGRYLNVGLCKYGKAKYFNIHQLVAMAFLNHIPDRHNIVVDHINNNGFDNRLVNLQIITIRENLSKNKKGSSKYTGVSWYKRTNKWMASIHLNGKDKNLGYYNNELDASKAYQKELKSLCAETQE